MKYLNNKNKLLKIDKKIFGISRMNKIKYPINRKNCSPCNKNANSKVSCYSSKSLNIILQKIKELNNFKLNIKKMSNNKK